MPRDRRGLELSAADEAAAALYDEVVQGYLAFRKDTGERLKAAFAADPEAPMLHCLRGYFMQLFAHRPLHRRAVESAAKAEALSARANPRERAHIAALRAWVADDTRRATAIWEEILSTHPRDILAAKLAHFTHFYFGDAAAMRASVERLLPAWDESLPGHGYILGMLAFAAEECGDYGPAEAAGRRAVELDAADIWATHAVAHVMEMQGRPRDGIGWLEGLSGGWGDIHNFVNHAWWHLALFRLELEQHEEVLRLYDEHFRAEESEEYLDLCNATSMLWRLGARGVDVGRRWEELAAKAETRLDDGLLAFADAHYMLALAATGRREAADRLLAAAEAARGAEGGHGWAMRECGADLLRAIDAEARGAPAEAVDLLLPLRGRFRCLGGSHAQRDLFEQMLIGAALAAGRTATARMLLAERTRANPNGVWSWRRTAEALERLGEAKGAAEARARAAALLAA